MLKMTSNVAMEQFPVYQWKLRLLFSIIILAWLWIYFESIFYGAVSLAFAGLAIGVINTLSRSFAVIDGREFSLRVIGRKALLYSSTRVIYLVLFYAMFAIVIYEIAMFVKSALLGVI